ncbi:tetratricopeptide repeat protein [Bacillus kexueae]|uniref:tetratricopeptide repeat protein n=1 Tax=Aeribacillus kexueae TaxID=2078952 RepID=UPI001FAE8413|nr:tetratricopeptide repeat protein [Bacillus kexueae]
MKKDEKKVVPLPGLKRRLVDKGMEALREKDFEASLRYFKEAEQWDDEDSEIMLGMAISLLELGNLAEAKNICKKMLNEDRGNYFTVLQIYLTILIQMGNYTEVQTTIEAVLEENKVPANHAEQLYKLLDFARRMNKAEDPTDDDIPLHQLLESFEQQAKFVQQVQQKNAIKYISTIQQFLEHEEVHPIVKTMLLQVLKEQEIFRKLVVKKFEQEMTVIPLELKDLSEDIFVQRVLNRLEDELSNENPTLFESLKDLWLRFLYVMYPFSPIPKNEELWAGALHLVGYQMFGIEVEEEEMLALYNVSIHELEPIIEQIHYIEEISNLQI